MVLPAEARPGVANVATAESGRAVTLSDNDERIAPTRPFCKGMQLEANCSMRASTETTPRQTASRPAIKAMCNGLLAS